jgi:hypothetical protein
MSTFDPILHWRLKRGSHAFPGPDGGTCINEAAIVAAGFPYQRVTTPADMPACFSRPICGLAMVLNDEADNDERQRLLPFVTRLACADTLEFEQARAKYINQHMEWTGPCPGPAELALYTIASTILLAIPRLSAGFDKGLKVLEGALAIGRQAHPFPAEEVQARFKAARPEEASKRDVFSKVKHWLAERQEA